MIVAMPMRGGEFVTMRLAATLTTMRDAARQSVALRGTLRDPGERPRDVVILDVSTSGFRAELPGDAIVEPGTRVRIAASAFGVHEAIAVRGGEGEGYGFAFTRPISPAMLSELGEEQPSTVMAFPATPLPMPPLVQTPFELPDPVAAIDAPPRISARASLAIMVGISSALWIVLAAIVAMISLYA